MLWLVPALSTHYPQSVLVLPFEWLTPIFPTLSVIYSQRPILTTQNKAAPSPHYSLLCILFLLSRSCHNL